tara:strand:- start:477 stop:2177 length:1701 start_codon:yes stop_codon:yes gene_type:complete
MVRYPLVTSKDFYKKINNIYSEYKLHKTNKTAKELCFPKKYKLQKPQIFVSKYISPKTPYRNLLIFHQIGAGKTCASIQVAEQWKNRRKILVAIPASLVGNYKNELRSECIGNTYLTSEERSILTQNSPSSIVYKRIIKKSDQRINKYYDILSHQKLINRIKNRSLRLSNKVLIIDEVQNLVSSSGDFYKILYKFLKNANICPIILLSATPMFDKPIELALTLNLLHLKEEIPIGRSFSSTFLTKYKNKDNEILYDIKNKDFLSKLVKGYVSYFRGADPKTFPKKKVYIVECKMKELQYRSYLTVNDKEGSFRNADILDMPQSFFLGSRSISNIAFPNKRIGKDGIKSFKGKYLKGKLLRECSEKFYKMIQLIRKSKGPVFVYSNFKEYAGLKAFQRVLEAYNFKNYKNHGTGKNRYALWSGDESLHYKEQLRVLFNNKKNMNADYIKVFLGSPSIKEGVSLLRVEQVHIMEPYWNISRVDQVIGRAIRYCSHKDVPKSRQKVNIFMYHSIHFKERITIDQYIYELAIKKQILINKFEKLLKESAIDCHLNKTMNSDKKNKLVCKK